MENEIVVTEKLDFKKTKASFIIYMAGQIFMILGIFSIGSQYKFFPRWIENFAFFSMLAYILIIIGLTRIRKLHISFSRSLITMGILITCSFVSHICSTSSDYTYLTFGKSLEWSCDLLFCISTIYFFIGCLHIFRELKNEKMIKQVKRVSISYFAMFVIFILFKLGSTMPFILNNIVANRIFIYGRLLSELINYLFVAICVVFIAIKVNLIRKEEELKNEEQQEIPQD